MNVLVLGFGVSGKSAAELLLAKGFSVWAFDVKLADDVAGWKRLGVRFFQSEAEVDLTQISLVVLSPGVDPLHELVVKAKGRKIEVIGEIELGFRYLKNKTIAITGTNGKTTTVLLTAHILNEAGKKAVFLGNVGNSFSSHLLRASPEEIFILELSSFQLETVSTRCLDGALILNITPNHLNRHASMDEYVEAKLNIRRSLKKKAPFWISHQVEKEFMVESPFILFDSPVSQLKPDRSDLRKGVVGKQNKEAASCICRYLGLNDEEIAKGMESFQKPSHRLEWVREIDGIDYYNDSKASSVHAVIHAVEFFQDPVILIAGGVDKGFSYQLWVEKFWGKVRQVIVFGEAAEKISVELRNSFPVKMVNVLQEAVLAAKEMASNGCVVLFSPGCSSYDQFRNFEERGDAFKSMVKML
jgi:UDP-N-acetylmuramoylalanine--D-glutamate ligase